MKRYFLRSGVLFTLLSLLLCAPLLVPASRGTLTDELLPFIAVTTLIGSILSITSGALTQSLSALGALVLNLACAAMGLFLWLGSPVA